MVKKSREEETEEQPEKKNEEWKVQLAITNEEQPPKKVFAKGEETTDLHGAVAKILNELGGIKKALLS